MQGSKHTGSDTKNDQRVKLYEMRGSKISKNVSLHPPSTFPRIHLFSKNKKNQKANVQSQTGGTFVIQNLDSPATTSTLTYKGRLKTDSSSYNARIGAGGNNGDANIPESVITLMEVSA